MKKIEKYTFIDLINKYRDIVGEEIMKVIYTSIFCGNKDAKRIVNNSIDKRMELYNKFPMTKESKMQLQTDVIYKKIEELCYDIEINDDDEAKKRFLMEINRRFSDKIPKKQKEELLDLILGKEQYITYEFNSEEYPEIREIDIVTRTIPKKLSDVKDARKQKILRIALEVAQKDDSIENLLDDKYEKEIKVAIHKELIQYFIKDGRMTLDEFRNMIEDKESINEDSVKELTKLESEFLENNFQYLDEEKLLLNLASQLMLNIKLSKGERINGIQNNNERYTSEEEKREEIERNIILLRDVYEELKSTKYEDIEFSVLDEDEEVLIVASKQTIIEFLSRCTNNDYLNDEDIEKIHSELLQGNLTPNLKERKIAGLNIDDLSKMMETYGREEEKRDKILSSAIELAEYLKNIGDTTNEQLIDLYLKGQLNLELVSQLNMDDISEESFRKKLEEMYGATLDCKVQEEKEQRFKELTRFTNLYKSLEEQGKFEIDKDKIIEEIIIDDYSENNMNDTIGDLHKIGLIELEEAVEWTGTDSIIRRYKEGNLKPAEVRDCYNKGKITLDQLAGIIKMIPENSEKFMMIGGIFPEEEDIETREILMLECMKLERGLKREPQGKVKRNEGKGPNNYNKYITDPFARLSLIQGLDPEYSFEMSQDGHAIITLPTLKKVIIEKMLDKDSLPSYGSATYLLNEEYYEKKRKEIVVGNKINRSVMIKDLEDDGVDRIIHGIESWGKSVKEYFGVEEKTRWNDEDIKKINDAIERIKRTYRTI